MFVNYTRARGLILSLLSKMLWKVMEVFRREWNAETKEMCYAKYNKLHSNLQWIKTDSTLGKSTYVLSIFLVIALENVFIHLLLDAKLLQMFYTKNTESLAAKIIWNITKNQALYSFLSLYTILIKYVLCYNYKKTS